MDRKDFLKSACALGVCGCALNLLGATSLLGAGKSTDEPDAADQRLVFARYQLAKLIGHLAAGACGCPLVDPERTPATWCHCSVGYQKENFEAIFGRPVEVTLKESKLQGGERCVFEVSLA